MREGWELWGLESAVFWVVSPKVLLISAAEREGRSWAGGKKSISGSGDFSVFTFLLSPPPQRGEGE